MITGSFLGIETAKKGLMTAQAGLDVTGHNISNAGTEGYSRQRIDVRAAYPISFPGPFVTMRPGTVGTGAEVYSITRARSEFVDAQIYSETSSKQYFDIMSSSFTRVQDIIGEPGENGINGLIESFFNAWEDLSNDPESASSRTNLREAALGLTDYVNEVEFKFTQETTNINEQISEKVVELNSLATQIAGINEQIIALEGGQGGVINANDLKDRRDLLVEQMSSLINTRVITNSNGGISVLIQGHPIVTNEFASDVSLRIDPNNPEQPVLEFTKSRIPLAVTSGEIAGLQQMRDVELPAVNERMAELITAFTNRVNALHITGYGLDGSKGRAFFTDIEHRRVEGTQFLPGTTTLDTTLDTLGISSGDFFVQGQRIVIEDKEVQSGSAITLGQLLERIDAANLDTRSQIDATTTSPRIVISQYNPVDASTPLTIKDGTSNFFEITGLLNATVRDIPLEPKYENSLSNFSVNSAILQDLDAIAAAGDDGLGFPGAGDNRIALAIADLKNDNQAISQTTFGEFFQASIATLGSAAQNTQRSLQSQQLVVDQLMTRREEISGVNLDEEAVNLIRFQRGFEACSRAITTMDEVLDMIVNRLGTSGR